MPQFAINLSPPAVAKLQAIVQRYNENTGQKLTAAQWLELHIKELLVADDLATEAQALERQAHDGLQEALRAARQRLIDGL
jgi:EAL domain-containing protein (putative c-di-GMP-specific phosphodiesterase class I)